MRHHVRRGRSGALVALLVLSLVPGCGGYVLRGRVVDGPAGAAFSVPAADEQLTKPGIGVAGVSLALYRDPDRPNEQLVARGSSDGDGNVAIPVSALGVGFTDEDWRLEVVAAGYETLAMHLRVPPAGGKQRLLVVITPGVSVPPAKPEDPWDLYQRFR